MNGWRDDGWMDDGWMDGRWPVFTARHRASSPPLARPRLITQPDPVALNRRGALLEDLMARQDLSVGLLDTAQLGEEVPELGPRPDDVRRPHLHPKDFLGGIGARLVGLGRKVAADDLILVPLVAADDLGRHGGGLGGGRVGEEGSRVGDEERGEEGRSEGGAWRPTKGGPCAGALGLGRGADDLGPSGPTDGAKTLSTPIKRKSSGLDIAAEATAFHRRACASQGGRQPAPTMAASGRVDIDVSRRGGERRDHHHSRGHDWPTEAIRHRLNPRRARRRRRPTHRLGRALGLSRTPLVARGATRHDG